ncbi:MAG: hypothetical protein WAW80_04850 [Candidatus Saccharimonadales bacterium]
MKLSSRLTNRFLIRNFVFICTALFVIPLATILLTQTSKAVPVTDFNAGNIIDDGVFYNKNTMNVQQIQNFLNGLIPYCDTWGTQTSEYGGGTRAQYAASVGWPGPPYACLNNYHENPSTGATSFENGGGAFSGGISAAQIIYDAAQQYNINPQVLLVMLKKESAGPLTADSWPLKSQYKYAMGYACPDSGPNYSANCESDKAGFYKQMMTAAWQLNYYKEHPNDYRYHIGWNDIQYSPVPSCGTKRIYIENMATLSLYIYTPYTPNAGALAAYPGEVTCGAYGNRNFYQYFKEWFGSTYAFIYKGVNYSAVFNPEYYINNNPDIQSSFGNNYFTAFDHFIRFGINEGRVASAEFNVTSYRNRYTDLRWAYGTNIPTYYWHYIAIGRYEGRDGSTSSAPLQPATVLGGVNYANIYDFATYMANNPDLQATYQNNDTGALWHFLNFGMNEGRVANNNFRVIPYRNKYVDLRIAFGANNLRAYYLHYLNIGSYEGRDSTGDYLGGRSAIGGVDYSAVYDFNHYAKSSPDVWQAHNIDDITTLNHFLRYGMNEGRIGNANFNVTNYKNRYGDLRAVFGNNLRDYYLHYINFGRAEGRNGA